MIVQLCNSRMDSTSRHRSPDTLLRLAKSQVVNTIHKGVTSLREKGSSWCLKYFSSREPLALRRHAMKTIQDYLAQASHMFQVCKISEQFVCCIASGLKVYNLLIGNNCFFVDACMILSLTESWLTKIFKIVNLTNFSNFHAINYRIHNDFHYS